jgi:dienelactone hydrolase
VTSPFKPRLYLINHSLYQDTTGSSTSKRGILFIYDVFGLFIQTIRGADILASGFAPLPDSGGEYQVFMPDFFGSGPADVSGFPAKTPAQIATLQAFFQGPANPAKNLGRVVPLMEAIQTAHPEIEEWAVFGTCWGGKLAAMLSTEGTLFRVAGQAHPSLIEIGDAEKVAIPMVVLPSVDEVPEVRSPCICSSGDVFSI